MANFKLGVLKLGCIGAAPLLDLIVDERADREDIDTRAYTSGAKLDPESCGPPTQALIDFTPDLALIVSPNAALPGPKQARNAVLEAGIPTIAIGDGPSKKAFFKKNDEGKQVKNVPDNLGFVVITSDPMIGARREFLDPTEMALFNADVIKVLSATGATRALQDVIDQAIESIRGGGSAELPTLTLNSDKAVAAGQFANPYAGAKAIAALQILESVAAITSKGCFVEQDASKYIPLVAAGHEMLRAATILAEEAREIEKAANTVARTPHAANGSALAKTELMAKPG
ncbi:MAG: F420-dependent methylenetetrahydromethanopterin dehydrogenase [Pseudomonadota bacterium]